MVSDLERGRRERRIPTDEFGDLSACVRAFNDQSGQDILLVRTAPDGFGLKDRHDPSSTPIPVRLGRWPETPNVLAMVLGKKGDRWISFRPVAGRLSAVAADFGLGEGAVERFLFAGEAVPRFQLFVGEPEKAAVEVVTSPNGDLDFSSPAGFFEQTQVSFAENFFAYVRFGDDHSIEGITCGSIAYHTFKLADGKLAKIEIRNKIRAAGFAVSVEGANGRPTLGINMVIGQSDFVPNRIFERALFRPFEAKELVTRILTRR